MSRAAILALALLPAPVAAQVAGPCEWIASARNIVEPWEDNTRTFANGDVRIAVLDTIEPGAAPVHLLILTPPRDELGGRHCHVVSHSEGVMGFADMSLRGMEAGHDPARGLVLSIPVSVFDADAAAPVAHVLTVVIDQATGTVAPVLSRR